MSDTPVNFLQCAITNAPGTAGPFTIGAAQAGMRTFDASHDGLTFTIDAYDPSIPGREDLNGCTYNHATRQLTRGTRADSTAVGQTALNLTAATILTVTPDAAWAAGLNTAIAAKADAAATTAALATKADATATSTALALKAPLASPALTGTPTAPTASGGTNTTQVATTAFVQAAVSGAGNVIAAGTLTANAVMLGDGGSATKTTTTGTGVVAALGVNVGSAGGVPAGSGITTDGASQLNIGVNATTAGKVKLFGSTSGDATIQTAAAAGTATVITLPATTSTLATLGANTFTGQQANSLNGTAGTPPALVSGTWFTGGTATTTKPQLLVEPSGTTSTAWSTSGTGLGVNAPSGFAGDLANLQLAGVKKFGVDANGQISGAGFQVSLSGGYWFFFLGTAIAGTNHPAANPPNFRICSNMAFAWNSTSGLDSGSLDTYLTRAASATIQLGLFDAASPVAQTFRAQGSRAGTDSNVAGANLTIFPGTGTGNAAPSSLILQSPVAVISGTGAQTQTTTLTLNSGNGTFAANLSVTRLLNFGPFTTGAAPTAVLGASYFDTTLNKLRIGGAGPAWETVTSV